MFLEDLDLVGICVQDQRRIEVMAEVVSPLRADGQRHRALAAARRRKERAYPELVGDIQRAELKLAFSLHGVVPLWILDCSQRVGVEKREL